VSQPNIIFQTGANSTPANSTEVATLQLDTDEHIQYVVESGGQANVTKEWTFTSAQTNTSLIAASGSEQICLLYSEVTVSNATQVDVGFRLGFTTTTLSAASSSGVTGIFSSHAGLPKGSGVVRTKAHVGSVGQDVLFTCGAPTSGTVRVVLEYVVVTA
jgi:hypothetical protein